MKVYLSGSVNGAYRAQNIIKIIGDAGIPFIYTPEYWSRLEVSNRFIRLVLGALLLLLTLPVRFLFIALSSCVFVLPMNTSFVVMAEVLIAKILRKRVVVDYYISQFDTLVNDRKRFVGSSIRGRIALFKDRFLLNKADEVIFLNKAESEYYQRIVGVDLRLEKISVIPLCIDYKKELFFSQYKGAEDFNVCWWGTYIPLHGLENLIKAFSFLKDKRIKLYLFGDSDEKSNPYRELIEKLHLRDKVKIDNQCSFSNGKLAPFLSKNCDLAIGNFGASEKARTVLVNKLVDSLSLGIPCLTMKTLATSELFEKNEGLIYTAPDPEQIAQKIVMCFQKKDELAAIGKAGMVKYLDTFSPDIFKVKILNLLNK